MARAPKVPVPVKKGSYFIRKRDRTVVHVDRVSKGQVTFHTRPMLLVYSSTLDAFRKNYRPCTAVEQAEEERSYNQR
jgi:hypothetical protein